MKSSILPTSSRRQYQVKFETFIALSLKTILGIAFYLLLSASCHSQNQGLYYDAKKLSEHMDEQNLEDAEEVYKILINYMPSGTATPAQIKEMLNKKGGQDPNPFLEIAGGDESNDNKSFSGIGRILGSVGSLNVTNFADGLAKFLVSRSKEELNVAFFRKFQDFIDDYPEARRIFPTTYDFLKNIYSYQYAAMLPALRRGFQKDLISFSNNLISLRELSPDECPEGVVSCAARITKIRDFFNNDPAGRSIVGSLIVTDNILKGKSAAEIVDNLANDAVAQKKDENFSNLIQFTQILSSSLRSIEPDEIWINKSELDDLVNNEEILRLYIGLLFQKNKLRSNPVSFRLSDRTITFQEVLESLAKNWNSLRDNYIASLRQVGNAAAQVSQNTKTLLAAKEQGAEVPLLTYSEYASSVSEFLKSAVKFFDTFEEISPDFPKLKLSVEKFTRVTDAGVAACYDIKSHNYTGLVLHTSMILENILDSAYTFKDKYIKYGTFMSSVVEAQSSDEVKAAIEAAVLPVGSSSIKRETHFNASINAFIGPMGGWEYLPKLKDDEWAFVTGFTAPVGIAFSWGKIRQRQRTVGKKERGGKSLTLFVPLIDVGSLATFRFGNDSSEVASEINLRNIISPGLYVYYGFGKCPISLGIGGQLGPQLRRVTAASQDLDENYYVRFGVNLVVDIPFFNLYTTSR